jgi:uncharacterized protein (DUF362 family)
MKWLWVACERFQQAEVAVLKANRYDAGLERKIRDGLQSLGIDAGWVTGKSILLKPNLVEPSVEAPHVNTHPAVVRAVVEVFLRWDARKVLVAEAPGHYRDSRWVLEQSGLGSVLQEAGVEYVDLNHDDVVEASNPLGFTRLPKFYLPRSLLRADRIVSLAKMKTHHWAGVTLSMKNLFGCLPGICYGWPKNVLHVQGIPRSILDVTATVRAHLAIIDGVVGMEGDGPIMGSPKQSGVIVMGKNLPAADATAARLMDLDPRRIPHLWAASGILGPVRASNIHQKGELIDPLIQRFELLDHPLMRPFRKSRG